MRKPGLHVPRRLPMLPLALAWVVAAAGAAAAQPAGAAEDPDAPLAVEARVDPIGFTVPTEIGVRVTRSAHVAVFEVRPGVGAVMRFPRGRDHGTALPAGLHRIPLDTGADGFRDGFERLRGSSGLPGGTGVTRPGLFHVGRPFLLVVASRDEMWLSGHYMGSVFRPRDARSSLALLVDALLRDVLPHPRAGAWAFDVRPGVPYLRPPGFGRSHRFPGRAPPRRRR